jgi:acetyltransferase-like isoleucine patch superfamily enzyme
VIGGVVVRKGTILAAGALLTEDTEEGYLYIGVPARKVRKQEWY